jgi:hypothetical protein
MEIEEGKGESGNRWNWFAILLNTCSLYGITLWIHKLNGCLQNWKINSGMNKMIVLGAKQVLVFPNLFIHYEQDMAKSVIILNYYNNVYEVHYEKGRL